MTALCPDRGQRAKISPSYWLLVLFIILGEAAPLRATHLLAARYARLAGQEVVVEVAVGQPPPPTLIVIQTLPPEVAVVQAEPATSSSNSKTGEVKWLLRGVKAGNLSLRLTLDRPVAAGEVSGEIRYREPGAGDMVTLPIAKP